MREDGYITAAEADKAKKEPLNVTVRTRGAHIFASEYFAEEVRRTILEKYDEKRLYEGGLSVRTTLDPKLQAMARKALVDGIVGFDEQAGYRGPITKIDVSGDWGVKLADVHALNDVSPWRLAVVLNVSDQAARIGLQTQPRAWRCRGARSPSWQHCARRNEMGEAGLRQVQAGHAREPGT